MRRQEDVLLAHVKLCTLYGRTETYRQLIFKAVYKSSSTARRGCRNRVRTAHRGAFEERQFKALEDAIVKLFAFYEQERAGVPNEPNVLTQVAGKHDHSNRKVEPRFYKPFIESLIDCVCGPMAQTELIFDPQCRDDSDAGRGFEASGT